MKRTCQSCGIRFYDLNHKPIVCPKCGAVNEPDLPFKVRRGGAAAPASKAPVPVEAPVPAAMAEKEEGELVEAEEAEELVEGEEDEEELIEDASDLGEDEDDVAEVKDHMDNGVGR
jgi:uncharacterized protein (TIGR02300 family)